MYRGDTHATYRGDRENAVFASSLGMTGFFASDNGQLASDASRGLRFCVHHHQPMLQEVKIRLSAADLQVLDAQVAAAGANRSQFIRDRVLSTALVKLTPTDYHRLVADSCAFMRGDLNPRHVETLIAYVITRLDQHSKQTATSDQPVA